MTVPAPEPGASTLQPAPAHAERLSVPLWWWALGIGVAALLAAEVHLGNPGVRSWLPYLVTIPLAVWALVRLGGTRVTVADGYLRAGPARLPLQHVARVAIVPATAKRAALGRQLDPAAYVQHRSWVPTMALVVLDDPDDPTPYWLVSTRHPEQLVRALGAEPA